MTLEEAILHCEEVAEKYEQVAFEAELQEEYDKITPCKECAAEHRQLADWLRELQEMRKQPEIVRCGECVHSNKEYSGEMWCGICNGFGIDENSFCSFAERRTDGHNQS